jgi:hypothetical protein
LVTVVVDAVNGGRCACQWESAAEWGMVHLYGDGTEGYGEVTEAIYEELCFGSVEYAEHMRSMSMKRNIPSSQST